MRGKLIVAAIFVQVLILGWMAGEREWIVRTAPAVWLRTAPVDPRDLFRGDYVTLGYEISTIPAAKFGPGLKHLLAEQSGKDADYHHSSRRETVLYVTLAIDPATGLASVAAADLTPPAAGVFITGRVRFYGQSPTTAITRVTYGIDAYYIQQGSGREFERRNPAGLEDGSQVPIEMRVAIGRNGTAVLTGHRWRALGIATKIEAGSMPGAPQSGNKMIRVTLRNFSSAPQAVVLPADLRTLHIERMAGGNGEGIYAEPPRTNLSDLTDSDVRVIPPEGSVTVDIDPALRLVKPGDAKDPVPLAGLKSDYQSYRIVYEAPAAAACRQLREAARITHETLPGRQFSTYELSR